MTDVKTEVKDEPVSEELLSKVSEQLGFYFGNVNLLRDRFMKDVMMKNDGWFPIATLLKFNRLKNLLKDYAEEASEKIVADGAKKISMLEVDADSKNIRRDPQSGLPKTRSESSTLIVKGFVTDKINMDDLLAFFKKYEGVEAVVMRNYREKIVNSKEEGVNIKDEDDNIKDEAVDIKDEDKPKDEKPELVYVKKFKGSVFVVFDTVDNAKLCLEALTDFKEKSPLLNEATPLTVMWQADHKLAKQAEIKARQELKRKSNQPAHEKTLLIRGAVLNIKGVPADVPREKLKEVWINALKEYDGKEDLNIAFVDYKVGQIDGRIRLTCAEAKKAVEFMQGKLVVTEGQPAVELSELTTEEEEDYLKQVELLKTSSFKSKRARGGGFSSGRRRGGRGRPMRGGRR